MAKGRFRQRRDVRAVHDHLAGGGLLQAVHQADQGGLARARAADDAQNRALRHGEVDLAQGRDRLEGFKVLKIGLFPDREELYRRLEKRLEQIFAKGILEETQSILDGGFTEEAKPFESIGYKQALQVIRGELSVSQAIFHARMETRRYAKRQMTWFRREPGIEIFKGFGDDPATRAAVLGRVERFMAG